MTLQETPDAGTTIGRARWRGGLGNGLLVGIAAVVLGIGARLPSVMAADLRLDQGVAAGRSGILTSVAVLLTTAAQPAVGLAAAVLVPLVLLLLRRRVLAVWIFGLFGVALAGAAVIKVMIAEPRPPAVLAAVSADTGNSFPSGHVTVAAAMCVTVWMLTRHRDLAWRILLGGVAAAFAVGVGWSRVYLGVHYLPDVVGSYLVVASAALLVNAFFGVPAVRALLDRLTPAACAPLVRVRPGGRSRSRGRAQVGAGEGDEHPEGDQVQDQG